MKIIILLLALSLTGCASLKDKFCDYKVIPPAEPIELDKRVLQSCKDLVLPTSPLTWEGILATTKANKLIYQDCFNKQEASIVLLKKFSNNQ